MRLNIIKNMEMNTIMSSSQQVQKDPSSSSKREKKTAEKQEKAEEVHIVAKEEKEKKKKPEVKEPESESESEEEYSGEESDEYEELDLTDNPMYQVLSTFFEDEEGNNICDYIGRLTDAVRDNTKMLSALLVESRHSKKSSDKEKEHRSK